MNGKAFESVRNECDPAAESARLESPIDAESKPPMPFEGICFECNLKPLFEQVLREMNGQSNISKRNDRLQKKQHVI
jgi:hypothetical protein